MDNQLILIADSDAKNLQILKNNLEAAGFLVSTVSNGKDAWEETLRTTPKLLLSETSLPGLSGYQLLERMNGDIKTAAIPVIFLTKQDDLQQRIKAFELGAKDYLVKPVHVKEVIAHIRMVIRRIEQHKVDQIDSYKKFSGRLDQLNLADLIESFGIERKTGILTISNGQRTGQVYFRDGAVINATLDDFKTEQAVYQMLPWDSGYFSMIFRDVEVSDKISISNLGLLLQGIKRLEIREKLLSQLPSPKTAFTISPTFKGLVDKKKVGNGASSFVALLDGKRNVNQILDESRLDDLIALNRLVRLYQQGFINPTIPAKIAPKQEVTFIEPEEKVSFIKKHETPQEIKLNRIEATTKEAFDQSMTLACEDHSIKQSEQSVEIETSDNYLSLENNGINAAQPNSDHIISELRPEEQNLAAAVEPLPSPFEEAQEENAFLLPPIKEKEIKSNSEGSLLTPVSNFPGLAPETKTTEIPSAPYEADIAEQPLAAKKEEKEIKSNSEGSLLTPVNDFPDLAPETKTTQIPSAPYEADIAEQPLAAKKEEKEIKSNSEGSLLTPVSNFPDLAPETKTTQILSAPYDAEIAEQPYAPEKNETDIVFPMKPPKSHFNLENELKPIIESIENAHKESSEELGTIDKPTSKEVPFSRPSDEALLASPISPVFAAEKNSDFSDLSYIDEELSKPSMLQLKKEPAAVAKSSDRPARKIEVVPEPQKMAVADSVKKRNKIILISVNDDCKDEMMDILTNNNFKSLAFLPANDFKIDIGKIIDKKYSHISIISVPVEKNLNSFFKSITASLIGNIFSFDCSHPETWEYTSYLLHSLWFKFKIPFIIAVMNLKEQEAITLDVIRYKLDLKGNTALMVWDEADKLAPEKLLHALISASHPESTDASFASDSLPIQ